VFGRRIGIKFITRFVLVIDHLNSDKNQLTSSFSHHKQYQRNSQPNTTKMVAISDSLAWELVKRNNSFMRKKSGQTRRSGAVTFSIERGNLMSKSSYKYSGLANSKTIDISATDDNRAALTKKTKKAVNSGKAGKASIALNKDFRRVEKTIVSQATDNYYRPDLKREALAKYSAVYRGNRAAKGVKKAVPIKRGRA
jgi:large subunit ribosomal protein L28e